MRNLGSRRKAIAEQQNTALVLKQVKLFNAPMMENISPPFPVFRPLLPNADKIVPFLRQIDGNRWYTNYGPLVVEFEKRLADHFGVASNQLATSANATLAISQTLRALNVESGSLCVMPSWTFVATPAASIWAGMEPYFIDVSPRNWLIEPEQVREIAAKRKIGAVIVVSAFGAPLNVAEWDDFTRETGVPVIIDAAAGFDSFTRARTGDVSTPIVVSLHATKVSGIGEGGVVITSDDQLAARVRHFGNFGFAGTREASVDGMNAKMSEYSAAIGLAMLDEWSERRDQWQCLASDFAAAVEQTPDIDCAPGFNQGWISSYGLIQLPERYEAAQIAAALSACGVETRQWWGEGCHLQPAYADYDHGTLAVTQQLADRVLGLPFWLGLTADDMAEIFSYLRDVMQDGKEVLRHG